MPNTHLTGQAVTRPYGQSRYRVGEQFGIAYEADVGVALRELETAAAEVPRVATAPDDGLRR